MLKKLRARFQGGATAEWHFHFWVAVGLALAASYYVYTAGAFDYDDYVLIVANPPLRDLSGLLTVIASGRPLRGLTLMIDYALFGLDARGYHLHNVLWHYFGSLAFYFLVFRLFGRRRLAAAAAVFFVLHPVHTEAVMGIAHRKELLAFTFMTLCYLTYLSASRGARSMILSLFFFLLALLSKQVVIVLPLFILLWELIGLGRRPSRENLIKPGLLFFPGVLLLAGGGWISGPLFRDFDLFGRMAPADVQAIGYTRIMATSFSVYPVEMKLLFFPVHLCLDHQVSPATVASPMALLGLAFFLGLFIVSRLMRRRKVISFSLLWIFVHLLPVMNWFPANAFLAERYLYIPSAGFCLLLGYLWDKLYMWRGELFPRKVYRWISVLTAFFFLGLLQIVPFTMRLPALWPPDRTYHLPPGIAVLISLLVSSAVFSPVFVSLNSGRLVEVLRKRFWYEGLVIFAAVTLMFLLTAVLVEFLLRRRVGLPEIEFSASVGRMTAWLKQHARPGPRTESVLMFPAGTLPAELFNIALYVLGGPTWVLWILSRLKNRKSEFPRNRALAWEIVFLVGLSLDTGGALRAGDWSSGVRLWRSTVLEEPASVTGWNNLGQAYFDRRRYALAADAFQQALRLKPDLPDTHRNLGLALLAQRDFTGASRAFENVLRYRPGDNDARINFANLLVLAADSGRNPDGYRQAVPQYLKAIAYDPRSAHAYFNLAYCYFKLGSLVEADAALAKALAIDPSSEKSRALWQMIHATEHKTDKAEPDQEP